MEFEADVNEGRFSKIKIILHDGKLEVNGNVYNLSDIEDVVLEEGLGINRIYIKNKGKKVLIAEFTNKKKEELLTLYYALKNKNVEIQSPKEKKRNVRHFLLSLISPYKYRVILGTILSSILVILSLIPPYLLKILINNVFEEKEVYLFIILVVSLIAVNVLNVIISAIQNFLLNLNGQRIVNSLRLKLYKHVMDMSSSFIDRYNTGRILSRLTTDISNTLWFVTWGIPAMITNVGTIIGVGVAIFLITPSLGIYSLIPFPIIIFGTIMYRRRSKIAYHKLWRRTADISSLLTDTIPNIDSIKSYVKEDFESNRLSKLNSEVISSQMNVIKTNLTWFPLISASISIITIIIWYLGGEEVLAGKIELGSLVAFVTYTTMFYQPVQNLINNVIPFSQQSLTSMDRLMEVFNAESDVRNPAEPKKIEVRGEVELKDVTFSYDQVKPIIKEVNLKVSKGEKVAIVGKSGSGKSTVVKLLLRLYDPQSGEILIDGVPLKELDLKSYREQVGLIRAEPTIFYGTVEYNIRYGKLNAKPEEIIASAMASGAHDFIMEMPFAYDTHLGERGNKISSGQKQMIEIARLFLKNPKMLILDEATASVDSYTERKIMDTLLSQFKDSTIIMIAHRVSTLYYADRIIVMEDGRIVEEGTLYELIRKKGKFYEIFQTQIPYMEEIKPGIEGRGFNYYLEMLKPVDLEVVDENKVKISGTLYAVENFWKPFPITRPSFLLIETSEGRYFTVEDFRKVKGEEILEKVVEARYFIPKIERILKIDTTGDEFVWSVITNKGDTTFKTRGRNSLFRVDGKVFIIDTEDDVFEIEFNSIDKRSAKMIDSIL
ncbi:DUF1854 domain-containing protein [Acidianus sp. HS-5]|uniref:ABC transporter transmembrane domain-containing protein n=1 Tax=Acidianus sp. HS-5 TaxID=2886040 RepID=UPI001F3DD0D9|nr:DUF1854 domain-containing protein [Acidianus sp. HS-5]BDC18844.1 ABC transporter ATP-binding protein [Acidianus sp. HS-5]